MAQPKSADRAAIAGWWKAIKNSTVPTNTRNGLRLSDTTSTLQPVATIATTAPAEHTQLASINYNHDQLAY